MPSLYSFLPEFEYLLTDLSSYSDEELFDKPLGILKQALVLMKHRTRKRTRELLISELFSSLEPFAQAGTYTNLIVSFSEYLWSIRGMDDDSLVQLIHTLPPNINERVMNTYEQIIQKGEKRGLEIGERKGRFRYRPRD